MNYQKLDPGLVMALRDTEASDKDTPAFNVFIRTSRAPAPDQVTYLERLGISSPTAGRRIFTATLSAQAVDELSKQPWVHYLQLSRQLQLLR